MDLNRNEDPETGSLYRGVAAFTGKSGRRERLLRTYATRPDDPAPYGEVYVIKSGDRIDVLAYQLLGDSRHWKLLADLNRDVLPDPQVLPVGVEIFVPFLNRVG